MTNVPYRFAMLSKARVQLSTALCCAALMLGCSEDFTESPAANVDEPTLRGILEPLLDDRAQLVLPMASAAYDARFAPAPAAEGEPAIHFDSVRLSDDGNTLVVLGGDASFVDPGGLFRGAASPLLFVAADGSVASLDAPNLRSLLLEKGGAGGLRAGAWSPFAAGKFVVLRIPLSATHSDAVTFAVRGVPPRALSLPDLPAFGAAGRAQSEDSIVVVYRDGLLGPVQASLWMIAGDGQPGVTSLHLDPNWHAAWPQDSLANRPDVAMFFWVEEVAPGVVAWVERRWLPQLPAAELVYARSDSPDEIVVGIGALSPSRSTDIRREPNGNLLVLGEDRVLRRWKVAEQGAVEVVSEPPDATWGSWAVWHGPGDALSTRYERGPGEVPAPQAYTALRLEDREWSHFEVTSTPCVSRDDCRSLGESYLLGVVGPPAEPIGLYLFWAWRRHPDQSGTGATYYSIIAAPAKRVKE
jgi:hypothetical protein